MKMYDKFVIIPNWLIYDKKGEINEMIKEDKIGNELVATAIWIYYNKTPYNEVGFTIRILMEKLPSQRKGSAFFRSFSAAH